jgi:hypothetical protein
MGVKVERFFSPRKAGTIEMKQIYKVLSHALVGARNFIVPDF